MTSHETGGNATLQIVFSRYSTEADREALAIADDENELDQAQRR